MRRLLALAVTLAVLLAFLAPRRSLAVEHTVAGSVQLDYLAVPTHSSDANQYGFDGFTTEVNLKLAIDISEHLSSNVKVCFGCHGFELDMAYLDYRLADEFNVRVGRFSPAFGSFNVRHDPGNHRLSDKPLPYDMGRMLRLRAWNLGVLPAPFPDNGLELDGTHWFGDKVSLDYAVYGVSGFKADAGAQDLDFVESRQAYYVDNNGRPTLGARAALTAKLGPRSEVTLGGSGMYGTFDPANKLSYAIVGSDLVFRLNKTNLRFEYLLRRQEFDTSNPALLTFAVAPERGGYFLKGGAYAEIEQPLSSVVDLIARLDGLYRIGNLPRGSLELSERSSVVRYTLGSSFAVEPRLRFKFSTELWQWSDKDDENHRLDLAFHAAAVGTF